MKKTIIMLSAFCFLAFAVQAQKATASTPPQTTKEPQKGGKHETPEQRAQQSVDRLDKIVGLTPEQKTQVHDLAIARANAVDAIRTKYKGQPDKKEAAKTEMQDARKQFRMSVKKLLTPEQMNKIKEYHKANKGKGKEAEPHEDMPTDKD